MLWDLYQDMKQIQEEIDGLFKWPAAFPRMYYTASTQSKYPPMNLREDSNNLFLDVKIPGLDIDNININIKDNTLSIRGEKPSPEAVNPKDYHRRERVAGNFIRAVELPMHVDADKVKADYENGIMTITLPKAESAKPKRIDVKVK